LGPIILIVSTTTVFISLKESLNKIWQVKAKPKKVVLKFFIDRLISLEFVASIGFIIIVSLTMDTMVAMLKVTMYGYMKSYSIYVVLVLNSIFSIAVSVLVFASIYKVLPDVEITWKEVWLGAIVTTVLFTIGKYLMAYYLETNNFDNAYGAAGSLVAMLAWVYFSVIILFLGAQFTFVYTKHQGKKIKPNKYAVAIEIVEVAKNEIMA
jgi:membrane protein